VTVTLDRPVGERFQFGEHAHPVRVGDVEPHVHGYAWRHPAPTASLVLVHGLQSHALWFAEAAGLLHERGVSLYALDRRGSGSSTGTRGDITRYGVWFDEVGAMVRLAQAEHPGVPVHLVGHCFGANVALGSILSGRAPDVRSLIMLTPGFYVLPDYGSMEKLRIAGGALLARGARFRVPQGDDLFSRDPDIVAWIAADGLGARTLTARCLWQINAMLGMLRRQAGDLRVPLLVCEAARDRLSDNRRNRALLNRALGERCHWATFDAEHFLLAEACRDEVLEKLMAWVTGLEATC